MGVSDFPTRGQIWLVHLDPTVGSEIRKTRPAVLISNDLNNRYANTVTLLPVTDRGEKIYPFEVALPAKGTGLTKESKIKCEQIRTVDKARLVKRLGQIPPSLLEDTHQALRLHLGMD